MKLIRFVRKVSSWLSSGLELVYLFSSRETNNEMNAFFAQLTFEENYFFAVWSSVALLT